MLSLAIAIVAVGGCESKGIKRPPPTTIRVINAAPHYPDVAVRREQNLEMTLEYGQGGTVRFDSGLYEFNFDTSLPDGSAQRIGKLSVTLTEDLVHTFVIVESANAVAPFLIESPPFESASDAEVIVVHAAKGHGAFDVYFETAGANLAAAAPLGSLAYREDSPPDTRTPDNYRVYLTAPGDPSTVLFESQTVPVLAGESSVMGILDDGGVGISQLVVTRFSQQGSAVLSDVNAQSGMRIVNGISDRTDRDVLVEGQLLFPAAAYGVPTGYVTTASGTSTLSVTPVGNPGAEELSVATPFPTGRLATTIIAGDLTDGLSRVTVTDDRRSLRTQATLRLLNGASLLNPIDVFIEPPGTDISQRFPLISLTAPGAAPLQDVEEGTYDLTLLDFTNGTVLAGPQSLTFANGGVYGILILDAVGGSTADVVLFEGF